jgi:hypothetical protein
MSTEHWTYKTAVFFLILSIIQYSNERYKRKRLGNHIRFRPQQKGLNTTMSVLKIPVETCNLITGPHPVSET